MEYTFTDEFNDIIYKNEQRAKLLYEMHPIQQLNQSISIYVIFMFYCKYILFGCIIILISNKLNKLL